MSLRSVLDCLPSELARLSSTFVTEVRAHESLTPYPSLPCLLEHLRRSESRSTEARKALIAELVRVHQAEPHRVWSTVLLHVFAPLLRKIRKSLLGSDAETRDEILLEEFARALLHVRTDDALRIFMYVRQEIRTRVFKALKEITTWEKIGFGVEADLEPDPITLSEPSLVGIWQKNFCARPEHAELLATLGDRGGIQALVDRRHTNLDAVARAAAFRCLQKQRQRLVAELRAQLDVEDRSVPSRLRATGNLPS